MAQAMIILDSAVATFGQSCGTSRGANMVEPGKSNRQWFSASGDIFCPATYGPGEWH